MGTWKWNVTKQPGIAMRNAGWNMECEMPNANRDALMPVPLSSNKQQATDNRHRQQADIKTQKTNTNTVTQTQTQTRDIEHEHGDSD